MLPLIPLAGMALVGIGRLLARRRQQNQQAPAAAVGRAVNTSTATPVNSVASAATSSPQTAQTPAGAANTGGQTAKNPVREVGQRQEPPPSPAATATTPTQSGGDPNLATRLGSESITRSRRRNREQQTALSGQSLK